ncbi:carbonic anhydrase 6 [Musca domestica]|uniref:Carbonic anhydrase 6 n=1 Tax=Musca domestica TaxID=7370 RepID=A0ABM3V2Y5_MUSDO|nr:carbonic anhydrase 6 [Musca domestica]
MQILGFANCNFDIDHKLTLFNDGNSLVGVVENDLLRPYVLIGSKLFKFHQWQSRWIKDGERSSEHSINGQFFDWESHMIFYDAKYLTFEEASKHENGVAIFARFGKVIAGLTEGILDNVLSVINNILRPGNVTYVIGFPYSYQGSLTTPACSPGVNWYIIGEPIELTEKNYEALWSMRDDNGNPIITNVRYLQKVGPRDVFGSI